MERIEFTRKSTFHRSSCSSGLFKIASAFVLSGSMLGVGAANAESLRIAVEASDETTKKANAYTDGKIKGLDARFSQVADESRKWADDRAAYRSGVAHDTSVKQSAEALLAERIKLSAETDKKIGKMADALHAEREAKVADAVGTLRSETDAKVEKTAGTLRSETDAKVANANDALRTETDVKAAKMADALHAEREVKVAEAVDTLRSETDAKVGKTAETLRAERDKKIGETEGKIAESADMLRAERDAISEMAAEVIRDERDEKIAETAATLRTERDAKVAKMADALHAEREAKVAEAVGTLRSEMVPKGLMTADGSLALGSDSEANGVNSTAVGDGAKAYKDNTTAVGNGASAWEPYASAFGQKASATGNGSTALGASALADGLNALAVGAGATASERGTAIGTASLAGEEALAVGLGAQAGDKSLAVGVGAIATNGAVALGNGVENDEAGTVQFAVTGEAKRLKGVAAGEADTDAVNVAQSKAVIEEVTSTMRTEMNAMGQASVNESVRQSTAYTDQKVGEIRRDMASMDRSFRRGIASSAALMMAAPYIPGKFVATAGTAVYRGTAAIAVGGSYWNHNGKWNINAGVSTSGHNSTIVRVGGAMVF